jgi:hypothetical protein
MIIRPPTADTTRVMFPPVDAWRSVTVDAGSTCDNRRFKNTDTGDWILETGYWNDSGHWIDEAAWID